MSERFYINCELTTGFVELVGPEAHHLAAVCRIRPGDAVCLFNGDGADYPATVVEVAKKRVGVEVRERRAVDRELPGRLEVAVSLPKGDRAEFLIEKLTELGVASFTPLICERSPVHPKESAIERFRRRVIEASKQCGRNVLMTVEPAATWEKYAAPRDGEVRLFAHPGQGSTGGVASVGAVRCAIGPEGGFTDGEVERASAQGWRGVDLGPRILRVETAAIAMALIATRPTQGRLSLGD